MIAVTTVIAILLLFLAWRRNAWMVALLGVVVGVTLGGPIADVIDAAITGVETAATTADQVARNGGR